MLCEICHKMEATKQLNKPINGNVKIYHVCSDCYDRCLYRAEPVEKRCKYCGKTLAEVKKSFTVGCPRCYQEFKEELQPIIRQVQQL